MCPDDTHCAFPSPDECASGDANGVWDGGAPPRGAICVGAAGRDVVYVAGDPVAQNLCGSIVVADLDVVDGPTAGRGSDPNRCPYVGYPVAVHDPAVAKSRGTYYLFSTGPGIPIWTSHDLRKWQPAGAVFASGADLWAPDISFFDGRWHLYYAKSTFGSKNSEIRLATSRTLKDAVWTDHGTVVRTDDTSDYNAIDPNVLVEGERVSLVLGSFWSGIKLFDVDPATGRIFGQPRTIASRLVPSWGIEASFVTKRAGFYYLFVSFDNCCRGAESTYNIRVGRATSLDGPYVDSGGVPMLLGGGTLVLAGEGMKRGPGHQAVLNDRLFFHYYDAADDGTAKLGILPITWTPDGWPTVRWSALKPTVMDAA